ncbi:TIGR03773 family transporter-associated surface protein [Pauljensenia sp. 20925_1_25]|uniref:TIGR03773 family transporter-associated surface protein n=1 Tax=Pauljensenia sp. 20925_1_25 TaxID=3003692 RepID=UPI00352E0BD2
MKLFSSQSDAGRRLFTTGLPLPVGAGPAAAPGASRRPRNTPGQALPLPPGLPLPVGAGSARPLAASPQASLGVSSRSPARPCRPRADLMWQTIMPPTEQSGRASHLEAQPGPVTAPGASRRPRLGMTLSALLVSALLFIVGAPSSVADPSPDPDLAQSVAAHEEWRGEASEISAGHVDLGPRLIDGQWRAGLRHDAESGAVWRDPNQTVLRVSDAAIMTAPDSADYPFLADVAGKPVHVIPQTQNPSVVWLGWNTQDPAVTATIDRGLTMRVGPVSGPGRAWLFLQSGTFGKPLLLADSGAAPGDVWIDSGTHVHANWAFSAPGTYTATVTFLGTTTAGEAVNASTTLRFAVGDAASASEALAMAAPAASGSGSGSGSGAPAAGTSQGPGSSESTSSSPEGGLPDWAFLAIIVSVALSLLVIGALVVARSRRSRAEQAAAIAEADSLLSPLPTARGEGNEEAATASSQSAGVSGVGESAEGHGLGNGGGEQ